MQQKVDGFLAGSYVKSKPHGVPTPEDIPLGNNAAEFEATVLFIDVRQSSDITNAFRRQTAAKMMKAYFVGAVNIVNRNQGFVRSFNGDGMLAIFRGDSRHDNAVKAAMQIKYFVDEVLEARFRRYFANNQTAVGNALGFDVGMGIDDGTIYAVRVGIRGTNDVAWVGRATNTAAKLSNVAVRPANVAVTDAVLGKLSGDRLHAGQNYMWSGGIEREFGGVERTVYMSTYRWVIK